MSKIKIDVTEASPKPIHVPLQFESSEIPSASSLLTVPSAPQPLTDLATLKVPPKHISGMRRMPCFRSLPNFFEAIDEPSHHRLFNDIPPEEVKKTKRRNSDLGEIEGLLDKILEPVCIREMHAGEKKQIQLTLPDRCRFLSRRPVD